MSKYPFDHIVTKLETTKGSGFALGVMGEAARIIRAIDNLHYPENPEDDETLCRKCFVAWPCVTHLFINGGAA